LPTPSRPEWTALSANSFASEPGTVANTAGCRKRTGSGPGVPGIPGTAIGAPCRESTSGPSSAGNRWNPCNLWPAGSVDRLSWTQEPAPASNRAFPVNPRNRCIGPPLNQWPQMAPMAQNQPPPTAPAVIRRPQDRINEMNRIRPGAGKGLSQEALLVIEANRRLPA
jgi:hypothetical protein